MGRKGYVLFVVPPSFRISEIDDSLDCHTSGKRAFVTGNGVRTCTFGRDRLSPYKYRLARGIRFLRVRALAAAGASSLKTSGKDMSRVFAIRIDYWNHNIARGRSK
jgi:hypothetical protein